MATVAVLNAKMKLNIQDFVKNMRKVSDTANTYSTKLNKSINEGMLDPVKKSKIEFKDVGRIVQGILISKVFYSGLNAIRQATNAVWDFSNQLEYAKMVYTSLFKSASLATEFINVLKDFAAVTPFSFQQSEAAAKRLLAYGIQYQNVMYVMRGVLEAATVQGSDVAIESVSRALGQIYTKGRLMEQEVRQLAEAGIPAYEIIQEKLNLVGDSMERIGDLGIPASVAINALVDGLHERFGTILDNASKTTIGIISNIKDNSVMFLSGMLKPLTDNMKVVLSDIEKVMYSLRTVYELRGIAGVLNEVIPASIKEDVTALIVNLSVLSDIFKTSVKSGFVIFRSLVVSLMRAFNALSGVIIGFVGVNAGMLKAIADNSKALKVFTNLIVAAGVAWSIYKIRALSALVATNAIKLMIPAIRGLIVSLNFLAAHPVWSLFALLGGTFIFLTGSSENLRNSINKLYQSFFNLFNVDTSKLFIEDISDRADDVSKFNNKLDDTRDSLDDISNSASKAAKGLLSFDEVFSLTKSSSDTSAPEVDFSGMFNGFEAFDFDLNDVDMNVGGLVESFVGNFTELLGGKEKIIAMSIGGLIGKALGFLLGGPIGSMLGGPIGMLAGWFWDKLANSLGLSDLSKIIFPISTGLLGLAAWLAAGAALGPVGGAMVVGIAALATWIINSINEALKTGDWSVAVTPIGAGIGTAIGFLIGGPAGALIGTGVGALVGHIGKLIMEGFNSGDFKVGEISMGMGIVLGGAILGIIGGPVGAVIGAAIGALVGWMATKVIENWDAIKGFADGIVTSLEDVGTSLAKTEEKINTNLDKAGSKIKDFTNNAKGFFVEFGNNIKDNIDQRLSLSSEQVTIQFDTMYSTFSTKTYDMALVASEKFGEIYESIRTNVSNGYDTFKLHVSNMSNSASVWFENTRLITATKFKNIKDNISETMGNAYDALSTKVTGMYDVTKDKFGSMKTFVSNKLKLLGIDVDIEFGKMHKDIFNILTDSDLTVFEKFTNIYNTVNTKISDMNTAVFNGLNALYKTFTTWIDDLGINVFDKLFGWLDDAIDGFKDFFKLSDESSKITPNTNVSQVLHTIDAPKIGHATGGIFNRAHIANVSEGNKSEAIIPLENSRAMQPFVDAVSNGLQATLLPILSTIVNANNNNNQQQQLRPLYVGTLVADDRGLKELERKMNIIRLSENERK